MASASASFVIVLLLQCIVLIGAKDPSASVFVVYKKDSQTFEFSTNENNIWVAHGQYSNSVNSTGWAFLKVETNASYPDEYQAFAAGMVEGYLTEELVHLHWINTMEGYCTKPYSSYCHKLLDFLSRNLEWMKSMIKQYSEDEPYWHQMELLLLQSAGLSDGVKRKPSRLNLNIDPFGLYMFQVDGDLDDLQSALSHKDDEKLLGSGSCSALVKLLPDYTELYVAHDTWNAYQSMLRVIKVYDFPFKMLDKENVQVPSRVQAFSSYPGTVLSGDDYYLLSSGMVSLETTISNNNAKLWKYITPQSVLEGFRSQVANRITRSGNDWAKIFSLFNSGTYNNEWIIIDYKQFQPGLQKLVPGLLTVLDQIPGLIIYKDLTSLLATQSYFPSFNIPYFPEIFNASGNQALVDKYGDWFTYNMTPRSQMFKRDHHNVKNIDSLIKLMRYNDYIHDPLSWCNCTPPYSAENAISARSDLNPVEGVYPFAALGHRSHGGTDMKATSAQMFMSLSFVAVAGPTWDQTPSFQWSKSDLFNISHLGQPDLWQFVPFLFNATNFFL